MDCDRVFRLDGETALITGGGSGLGLAMATAMAHAGAKVVVVGRREEPLREACAAIGDAASYEVCDITRFDGVGAMLARVAERHGRPSILVNNAGVHLKRPAVETSVEAFAEVLDAHVLAAHNLTRLVSKRSGPRPRRRGFHQCVNLSVTVVVHTVIALDRPCRGRARQKRRRINKRTKFDFAVHRSSLD